MALRIYGLVLFPNPDQLIDVNAVKIFISRNPIPTLLGDILHSFYTRPMRKRGVLMCCTPLLARWFILHLPQSVLKNEQGLMWSQRLMTLTHSDVHWCSRSRENVIIVDRCGEFPNVPLLGIRGGITYNPCLASMAVWICMEGWPSRHVDSWPSFWLQQRCARTSPKIHQSLGEAQKGW